MPAEQMGSPTRMAENPAQIDPARSAKPPWRAPSQGRQISKTTFSPIRRSADLVGMIPHRCQKYRPSRQDCPGFSLIGYYAARSIPPERSGGEPARMPRLQGQNQGALRFAPRQQRHSSRHERAVLARCWVVPQVVAVRKGAVLVSVFSAQQRQVFTPVSCGFPGGERPEQRRSLVSGFLAGFS